MHSFTNTKQLTGMIVCVALLFACQPDKQTGLNEKELLGKQLSSTRIFRNLQGNPVQPVTRQRKVLQIYIPVSLLKEQSRDALAIVTR